MRTSFAFALLLSLTLAACQPAAAPAELSDADVQAIEAALTANIDAFINEDVAGLAATYAEDAVQYAPNNIRMGNQAIAEAMADGDNLALSVEADEIAGVGDLAYWVGTYEYEGVPAAVDSTVADSGNWLLIFRRGDDGSWRISKEIWNSPVPMPAAADTTEGM